MDIGIISVSLDDWQIVCKFSNDALEIMLLEAEFEILAFCFGKSIPSFSLFFNFFFKA